MASRIDQADAVILMHDRAMVMRAYHEVNTPEALEKIQSLTFQNSTVTLAGSRMDSNYHDVRFLLGLYPVHGLLSERKKRLECHSFPKSRRKPTLDVRIRKTDDCNIESMPLQGHILLEIRFSIICTDGIGCKQRHIHGLDQTVIDLMPSLDVMISNDYRIVADVLDHAGIKMLGKCIDIIVVIRGIVSLQAVSCIQKYHIINTFRNPYTIDIPRDIRKGRGRTILNIKRIEVPSMYIICSKEAESIFSVLRAAA